MCATRTDLVAYPLAAVGEACHSRGIPWLAVTTDPRGRLLRMAVLMWSNADRAARTWRMGEWALLNQVRADGSSKPRIRPVLLLTGEAASTSMTDTAYPSLARTSSARRRGFL